jgi:Protein of unknown function (DUF2806)
MLREQRNREAVSSIAVKELAESGFTGAPNARPLSDDWLDMFARAAEKLSEENARLHFGKLLAAEIRSPGSFSPAALQILSVMGPEMAELFRALCATVVSFPAITNELIFVLAEPFGRPGQNALAPFGLGYWNLLKLQSAGLIHTDLDAWRQFPMAVFMTGACIGGVQIRPPAPEPPSPAALALMLRMNVLNLTPPAAELREIVETMPHAGYVEGVISWLDGQLASLAPADGT